MQVFRKYLLPAVYFMLGFALVSAIHAGGFQTLREASGDPALPAPELIAPADDSRFGRDSGMPDFSWNALEGATGYTIQLASDPDFESIRIAMQRDAAAFSLSDAMTFEEWNALDERIYWRVRGIDASGTPGEWSSVWTLVKTSLASPVITAPRDDARYNMETELPFFAWKPQEDAAGYTVAFATDFDFEDYLGEVRVSRPELDLSSADRALWDPIQSRFYWRVCADDARDLPGPWSKTQRITKTTMETPAIQSPGFPYFYAGVYSEPPVFSWSALPEASGYTLEICDDENFFDIEWSYFTRENAYDVKPEVEEWEWRQAYGSFYWHVCGVDAKGLDGVWSATGFFLKNGQRRIVAFGDSITYGDGYPEGPGYLGFLQEWLDNDFPGTVVINEGIPGAKSAQAKWEMQAVLERNFPEFVLIMFGTNDSVDPYGCTYWGEPYGCLVKENLREAIQIAFDHDVFPILATIPKTNPEGEWPDNDWGEYDNEQIRELAEEMNVVLVDIYEHFENYEGYLPDLFVDSLHFNRDGYEYMAHAWYDTLYPLMN